MFNDKSDGFKLVTYNNRRQHKIKLKVNKKYDGIDCDYPVDEILSKTNAAINVFKESAFYQNLLDELKKLLDILRIDSIVDIVCYGLGNFSKHNCSKYQLAALLSIKSVYSSNVYIYDPIFTKNEIECLKQLDLQFINYNEEGKRVLNDCSTLVFMPHCSKQLVNNFLYANWTSLISNCILIGNSWSELECHTTDALLKKTAYFLYKLKPYVTEIKLKNNFQYPNTFSGTSIHGFIKEKLNASSNFWERNPDFLCIHNDPEFITITR